MLTLAKYSIGVGDRFAQQARAQLRACILAAQQGAEVVPVWNKSHREHMTVGSQPGSVRATAEAAVKELGWKKPYHVDADHIRLDTVDGFLASSDFYTIDVADAIGRQVEPSAVTAFADRHPELLGGAAIPGLDRPLATTRADIEKFAAKYLAAVRDAGAIYRHIAAAKGAGNFITEVSMDETDRPQTPPELLTILAALADEKIPLQTIAPKFTGRFNKGVDYAGDLAKFEKEFGDDLAVIAFAVQTYGLPANFKLSVHSGSDKFSIYAPIRRALQRFDAGLHLKTAGTTWLEEVIGLAEAGGEGLDLAKEIYNKALDKRDALCAPYAAVIDIDPARLPPVDVVERWSSAQFVAALRHNPHCREFNPDLRQLIHVGYKIAAQMGRRYLDLLERCEPTVAKNVTTNLFERHLKPLYL
jgi:tagaturonate epimerase